MRVLMTTFGSRGDVEPIAGLAAELRARGAEAVVCAPPDEEFRQRLDGLGVELVPMGEPVRPQLSGDRPPSTADAPRRAAGLVESQFAAVMRAGADCDAVIGTGLPPAGAALAAERLGVRYVCAAFVPGVIPSPLVRPLARPGRPYPADETDNLVLWDIDAANIRDLYGPALNAHRAALGLDPVEDVRGYILTDRPWLATDPVLGPWPEAPGYAAVQTGAWFVPDERPLPEDLEAFLDAGDPPVYVGFGSMPWKNGREAAEAAVAAVRAQGRRLVVSRGWADLGATGGDCFAVGESNHRKLFARMAAVVHHGGAGTTHKAAAAGAPQVVVPQIADQPYWAGRVAALGIGAGHDGPVPTFDAMTAALETALAPETKARAVEVAGRMRTDGAARTAELLIEGRAA
ncbi:vancomycin aglycone glucosyltransferase [Glycomyces sambucus]|uniref:Vancomycin aglycone glucosyltransferase n=1 Tax=Glycomyces sambucus TaxID=380244 RepID=A0A1G9K9X3_9ACTN|nr:glycosyltransferase [Glycomyces sambucus]SDL46366.1 vancomycin aglycone glucosyltransferase [Glycomyces sambucus]